MICTQQPIRTSAIGIYMALGSAIDGVETELDRETFLVSERARLAAKKTELLEEKSRVQSELGEIKTRLLRTRGRMATQHYLQLMERRSKLLYRNGNIDRETSSISVEMKGLNEELSALRKKIDSDRKLGERQAELSAQLVLNHLRALFALRKHYQEFAADGTRVASMRQMAAEFVVKLNPVIESATAAMSDNSEVTA